MQDQDKTRQQLLAENAELRQQVATLQASAERYRLRVEAVPLPIWRSDASGELLEVNRCWEDYTGQTAAEARGGGWMRVIHPDDLPRIREDIRAGMAGGAMYRSEYRIRRASDGSYRWHLARGAPWNDEHGTLVGWCGYATDIDDQKRVEAALRQSERRLALHIQQTPLAAIEWAVDGRVTKWNPSAERIFGYAEREALGRHVSFIVPPSFRQRAGQIWSDLLACKGGERSTNENITKDGRTIWCEWYNTPLIDAEGHVIGIASLGLDITEPKRTEEDLRESGERFRQAMEATQDGLWDWNVQSGEVYYSPGYYRMLGYEAADFAGLLQSWIELLHPEDRAEALRVNQDCIENRIPHFEVEFRMRAKGGEWKTILGRGKAVARDAHGRATRMIGTHVDITPRRRAEEALQKAHDELEEQVELRTAELRKVNEQLRIFRQFADGSAQGFSMADLDGNLLYMNPALCRMLAEDQPQDRLGQHISQYYSPAVNRTRDTERLPVLMREGYWQGEVPMLSRRGDVIPTWHHTFLIRDESGAPLRLAVVITDITEQKRAAEALRASEERFRVAFEEAPVGMVIGVGNGIIAQINRALCRMGGYSQEELLGRHVRDLTHPDDREASVVSTRQLLAGEIPSFTLEKRYLRKDGQPFWAQATTAAIRGPDGKVAFALGIVEDITQRKQAEAALRQSAEKYRLLIETTGTGYLILDGQGRVIDANAEYLRICGHAELKDILGRTVVEWTAPHDVQRNAQEAQQCFQRGSVRRLEIDYVRPDGTLLPVEINATRIDTEEGRRILALCQDISERRQVQAALRQSHDELRAIYDGMVVGLNILNLRTLLPVRANSALCRMLGYSEEELCRLTPADVHPPQDQPWVARQFQEYLAGQRSGINDVPLLRKDGSVIYVDTTGSRILYNGEPCVVCFFHDATDRRKALDAEQRERRTLEHLLQASDHERQLIAYDIHDGLAQELAGAIMQFQVFDQLRERNPSEAQKSYDGGVMLLRQAHAEARRLISGVRPPILDESGVMAAISHLIHDPAFARGLKVQLRSRVDFSRLNPVVENVIYRIVQEALSNARNHSQSQRVVIRLLQRADRLRIEVRDWGVGFDPDQVDQSRFGLEGIRERARLLGGRCGIKSRPGKGTAVIVELPVVEGP